MNILQRTQFYVKWVSVLISCCKREFLIIKKGKNWWISNWWKIFWISLFFNRFKMEHELFQVFEKEEHIHMEYLPLLTNYICGSLNSHYLPNRSYYYQQYNYVTKLKIVCMWKQKHGLPTVSCKWEAICNDQLVNFF